MNNLTGPPFYYDYQNAAIGTVMPSTVHVKNTALSRYFQRYLLQKIMSVFKWELPETWVENYFKYVLYCWGYIAVINTDKFGVICQQCGLRGYDVFYRPTNVIVTNPLINRTVEPRIGTQCTLIQLQPDYGGVLDIVTYYGDMMALMAESVAVSALNSKNAYVFAASDATIANSLKKMYDNLASGEPATVVNKKLFDEETGKIKMEMFGDGKQSTIVNEMLNALATVELSFDKDIGLPVMPSSKRERDLEAEINQNIINSVSKVGMWLQQLQKSCKETNKMFGTEISVDWRNPPRIGGNSINEGESKSIRNDATRPDNNG